MVTKTVMTPESHQLALILNFLSPAFPTGAFAYSHGLERAIGDGLVTDGDSTFDWVSALLTDGSGWNDAVLIANTREDTMEDINALALSLSAGRERHLETTALGASFAEAARSFTTLPLPEGPVAYPVAVAAAGIATGIARETLILAYCQAFAASLVSVAVRLVPIGQKAGLGVQARLIPLLAETARRAAESTLDDLGSATFLSDIASIRHEHQHTRIFRT